MDSGVVRKSDIRVGIYNSFFVMNRIKILLVFSFVMFFNDISAQAYKGLNIESFESYNYRRNHKNEITYSNYNGSKSYIEAKFIKKNNDAAFSFYNDGRIYDFRNSHRKGWYFVGEEMDYKCYKVYIRWNDGGETTGKLDYYKRADGRPVFGIKKFDGGYSIYRPK